jgi:hypothetical protein
VKYKKKVDDPKSCEFVLNRAKYQTRSFEPSFRSTQMWEVSSESEKHLALLPAIHYSHWIPGNGWLFRTTHSNAADSSKIEYVSEIVA